MWGHQTCVPICLTVLVRKFVGSTDIRLFFSKYKRVSRKYRNRGVHKCEFALPTNLIFKSWWRHLCILKHFRGWNYGQKSLLYQWTSTLHSKLYGSKWSSDMVGLKSQPVTSGCTRLKKRKNARNQENNLRSDNNRSRNDVSASAKAAHTVRCFWRKYSAVFDKKDFSRCKQN